VKKGAEDDNATVVTAAELPMPETSIDLRVVRKANATHRTTKDIHYILELGFGYGG